MNRTLDYVSVDTGPNPTRCVIWLHGLGADGYDFVPMLKELEQLGLPPTRFVFPHAPMIPVSINGGHVMRAWYDIKHVDLKRQEDEAGIRQSQKTVDTLIEQNIQAGFQSTQIVLVGFSQGGAVVYQTGLRSAHPLAGLIALSTYLTCTDSFEAERSPANQNTPILCVHGTQDAVVPLERGQHAIDVLKQHHYKVQWHTYPMGHSVCVEEIENIAQFLIGVFKP